MTKLEAIAALEFAFAHNKDFKKDWKEYIELTILEAMEDLESKISTEDQLKIATRSSEKMLRLLFDSAWWEAQGLI